MHHEFVFCDRRSAPTPNSVQTKTPSYPPRPLPQTFSTARPTLESALTANSADHLVDSHLDRVGSSLPEPFPTRRVAAANPGSETARRRTCTAIPIKPSPNIPSSHSRAIRCAPAASRLVSTRLPHPLATSALHAAAASGALTARLRAR
ncbi:hypothetical protein PSPO01_10798 [Paraphaeosphaeria sporulosa]